MLFVGLSKFEELGFLFLAIEILTVVGVFKTVRKAGRSGILGLIPIIQDFQLFDVCWDSGVCIGYWILSGVYMLLGLVGAIPVLGIVANIINVVIGLILIFIHVKLMLKLCRCFGVNVIIAIVSIFLPFVAPLVIGFGNYTYRGKVA